MSDLAYPTPLHIGTISPYSAWVEGRGYQSSGSPASITWVANLAIYVPMVLPFPYLVSRLWWMNGATLTSSSADVGVYTSDGRLVCSAGSTTQTGTQTIQYVALGTPVLLGPGAYYFAWVSNNTTGRAFGLALTVSNGRSAGVLQQASAIPLPTQATFATFANALIPWCGITRTASGF